MQSIDIKALLWTQELVILAKFYDNKAKTEDSLLLVNFGPKCKSVRTVSK